MKRHVTNEKERYLEIQRRENVLKEVGGDFICGSHCKCELEFFIVSVMMFIKH